MSTIAPGNNSTVSNFFNLGLESNIPSVERKAIATLTIAAIGVVCVAISIISLVGVAIAIGAGAIIATSVIATLASAIGSFAVMTAIALLAKHLLNGKIGPGTSINCSYTPSPDASQFKKHTETPRPAKGGSILTPKTPSPVPSDRKEKTMKNTCQVFIDSEEKVTSPVAKENNSFALETKVEEVNPALKQVQEYETELEYLVNTKVTPENGTLLTERLKALSKKLPNNAPVQQTLQKLLIRNIAAFSALITQTTKNIPSRLDLSILDSNDE